MARKTLDYTHGDTGTKPVNSLNFGPNDRPQAGHFDWYWYNVSQAIDGFTEEFNRLDSNDDGIVDETDSVTAGGNLKGDLKASDGEVVWDESGGYIPQSRLQNDTVTVNAGTGISSAGSASLGNSLSISVDDSRYLLTSGDTLTGTLTLQDGSAAASRSWVKEQPSSVEVKTSDPSNPEDGQTWIIE